MVTASLTTIFLKLLVIACVIVYFLPTLIAMLRDHPQKIQIFILDLLSGWSGVGWVLAVIWACRKFSRRRWTPLPPEPEY
jgi:hypothetical protein